MIDDLAVKFNLFSSVALSERDGLNSKRKGIVLGNVSEEIYSRFDKPINHFLLHFFSELMREENFQLLWEQLRVLGEMEGKLKSF